MHGESNLVASLVERLVTRLPHRTGSSSELLEQDELVSQIRATLIGISTTRLSTVIESVLSVLEELINQYLDIDADPPPHVRSSETYLIALLAQCCCANWDHVNKSSPDAPRRDEESGASRRTPFAFDPYKQAAQSSPTGDAQKRSKTRKRDTRPKPLDDILVGRVLEVLKEFLAPFPEHYTLPGATILGESAYPAAKLSSPQDNERVSSAVSSRTYSSYDEVEDTDVHCRVIVEFLSASNWVMIFEHLRRLLRALQVPIVQQANSAPNSAVVEHDHDALVTLRFVAFFWVDARALRLVLSEIATCFYNLRKPLQNTLALVLPTLIMRWIEHKPEEFTDLHATHTKLDNGVDRLFDMANSMIDNGRWRSVLYPFQISLLFLIPDVFDVATSMPTVGRYMDNSALPKAGSPILKKVAFLESLRKALRNRNSAAAYSLVLLLRTARHFDMDVSDSALLSYALDVQDDIREALFRKSASTKEPAVFDDGLMTAALVTLATLNFKTFETLVVPLCFTPVATNDYRTALLSACTYLATAPDHNRYIPVLKRVALLVRSHLKDLWLNDRSQLSALQASTTSPSSTELLTVRGLKFLETLPLTMFDGAPELCTDYEDFFQENFCIMVNCLLVGNENVKRAAVGMYKSVLADGSIFCVPEHVDLGSDDTARSLWRWTSAVLGNVLDSAAGSAASSAALLGFMHSFLKARLEMIRGLKETSLPSTEIFEHLDTLVKMENFFLNCLCSADIETCQLVISCIRLLCEEAVIVDDAEDSAQPSLNTRNLEVYQALSSKEFRFTGLVAFQKRFRSILRDIKEPSPGILKTWENVFERWHRLSTRLFSLRKLDSFDERLFIEWRNCMGFLASSAACCVSTQLSMPADLAMAGSKWIDLPIQADHDQSLLDAFMTKSMNLLECVHIRVREAVKEALSSELSPSLYYPLFLTLETTLQTLFSGPVDPSAKFPEAHIAFAEQAAALLKTITERLDNPTDVGGSVSIDVGGLTKNFALWLCGMRDGANVLRIKIRVCQLCEMITRKKDLLNLRQDVQIRNHLVEILFSWIARPGSPLPSLSESAPRDDMAKLQKDLDKACLSALGDLTFRLPLQPPNANGQTDAENSDLKSDMFRSYFDKFLSHLKLETVVDASRTDILTIRPSKDDPTSTRELAIVALSNLLSANIDIGLKHSLTIGYHDDLNIRTAFLTVLCNVLAQGTEFINLSDVATKEKYDELVEVLVNDMALTVALCDACPSTEVDELTMSLLNIFDSRGLGFVLLEHLIKHEVEKTDNEAELLRGNSVTTKMLFVYGKWKGAAYLRTTLQNLLERLTQTAHDLDLELDPNRTTTLGEQQRNAVQLRLVTKVFIDDICNSAPTIPVSFRRICSIISTSVTIKFPDAKYNAVGSFIFLRFFCPAICSPNEHGLTSTPPPPELRRGLVLIAKIIQNLANNVLFGAKEGYMDTLNDFMARHGPRVTAFLREISAAPHIDDTGTEKEVFDFGSCVALHRFLYDHWDHVRQRIAVQQRRVSPRGPQDIGPGRLPVVEILRTLISNLGPPPMNISWNRPEVSRNSPPLYSRFQHFMLRNAGRSAESEITTNALFDAGENKDGMATICIVLRNIDAEAAADFDLLIFCYLKIASRMWKKPFCILVDSTCYTGQNEAQEALFKKLELLAPAEMRKNLTNIYIYNMNSAFRKCFRRIMRLSMKSEENMLHPENVRYKFISSVEDLQYQFHQNQLPGETLSIVSDARFVFQPVIRLSKTKGRIDVVTQVGSQFVQIMTTKKQEVAPGLGLSATVNDIFRLTEVDEVPTSIQTDGDSAFGLRTESGKIVMYFTTHRKMEILQAIRGAKNKHIKDTKPLPLLERSVRAKDVPGTMINMALMNMASFDQHMRIEGYNLICALCKTFRFATSSNFLACKELVMPPNAGPFIISVSKELATSEPQLTADFVNEFFVGWDHFPPYQRHLSLAYLAPWLPALRTHVLATESDGEKARDKVAAIFRRLMEVAVSDPSLAMALQQNVWPILCKDDVLIDILLDELVKTALVTGSTQNRRISAMSTVVTSLDTIVVRGKIIARLRKAINRTSLRPTRTLPDNPIWNEICVLLKLCLKLSFNSEAQGHLYFAETSHIITMLANTGSDDMRLGVHSLLINTIHAFCTNSSLEEAKLGPLRTILSSLSSEANGQQQLLLNGVSREGVLVPQGPQHSMQIMSTTEELAKLLLKISHLGATSVDLENSWRCRWMSLVASTAFQSNPAIQPRAFTVMGCIAQEEVDDDLLYQVLVALRNSVNRFTVDNDNDMLASIVTSLTKMMKNLPTTSRYGLQLFWLAMALVRLVPLSLFSCAASFLQAVLLNINTSGDLKDGRMVQVLLQGRLPLEDSATLLDESYGIHFNPDNFHFAVCASLVKGLTDNSTKATTLKALSTFLEVTSSNSPGSRAFPDDMCCLPYLVLLVNRATQADESKGNVWLVAGSSTGATIAATEQMMKSIPLDLLKDKELLLNAAIGLVDFRYLEDSIQNRGLRWLNQVAINRPTVVLHLFQPIFGIVDDVLHSSQNSQTFQSAQTLLRTLTTSPKLIDTVDTDSLLEVVMGEIGFGGLWRSSTFHTSSERDKRCSALTEKLIELIIS